MHLASHFSGKILISEQATEFLNFCSSFPQSCDLSYCLVSFEGRQPRLHPLYQIYVFFVMGFFSQELDLTMWMMWWDLGGSKLVDNLDVKWIHMLPASHILQLLLIHKGLPNDCPQESLLQSSNILVFLLQSPCNHSRGSLGPRELNQLNS